MKVAATKTSFIFFMTIAASASAMAKKTEATESKPSMKQLADKWNIVDTTVDYSSISKILDFPKEQEIDADLLEPAHCS